MSIQLPDGTAIGNWSPGWEKNLPKWYTDGYESGLFNESNNWGSDFFPQYRGGKRIPAVIPGGSYKVPGYHTDVEEAPKGSADLTPGQNFLGGLLNAPGFVEDMANTKGVTGGPYATGENSGEPILNPNHPLNRMPPPQPLPPIPGATQEIPVEPWVDERYNPFEGQWIIDGAGNRVPRTPENSVSGP